MKVSRLLGRMLKFLRIAYLAGLAVLIGWVGRSEWNEVTDLLDGARPGLIIASLAASFVLIVIGAWFWTVSLRIQGAGLDEPRLLATATLATARSTLARYVARIGVVRGRPGRAAAQRRTAGRTAQRHRRSRDGHQPDGGADERAVRPGPLGPGFPAAPYGWCSSPAP